MKPRDNLANTQENNKLTQALWRKPAKLVKPRLQIHSFSVLTEVKKNTYRKANVAFSADPEIQQR